MANSLFPAFQYASGRPRPLCELHHGTRTRWLSLALLIVLAAWPARGQSPSADAIVGTWYAEEGGMYVRIEPCEEAAYCGRIVALDDSSAHAPRRDVNNPDEALRNRPLKGLRILTGLTYDKEDRTWSGGKMYAPQRGRHVNVEFRMPRPDALPVTPSKFIFRKKMVWTRQRE